MKSDDNYMMSIVVPVYNRASVAGRTLASLAAQTATAIEVILVDNNSTDGTLALLTCWAEATRRRGFGIVVAQCKRPGASAARNVGLAMARAPMVMFFDSDDIMPPGHVADALEALNRHPDADIIGWDYTSHNGNAVHTDRFFGTDMMWNNLFHGAMSSARWCARTDLVRRAGGWNDNIGYWDDIELGARMLSLNPKVYYRGLSGVEVYNHPDSISGTYRADPARIEPALRSIETVLGQTLWTDIKRAIEYARSARAGNAGAAAMQRHLLSEVRPCRRMLLAAVYIYTRVGLRGAARVVKPLVRTICHPRTLSLPD